MNINHRNHRQSWLGRLAALLAVAMLASMLPVSALAELPGAWSSGDDIRANSALESEDELGSGGMALYGSDEGSDEESEEEEAHTPVITGFELSTTEYEFSYKPDLDVLRSNLPSSVCMYVDGTSAYVDVFWECDDYAESNSGDFIFEAEFDTGTVYIGDRSWDIDELIFDDGVRMPRIRVIVNAVTGFDPLDRTVYATSRKPDSIEDAVSSMDLPDVVYGYVNGSGERTAFAVNWFCENFGAEFSDEFIFNASFRGEQYALKDGVEMPSVTLKLVESDEFDVGDIDEENMTLTITGWKYDDTFLQVPREIEGYTVTAIDDHAFSDCHMLTAVELPDSIESYGKNVFGSNSGITEVRFTVASESTTLFTREDGRAAYIHEVEDIPVELPLPVTDIEVLPGGSLFLDGDFTLLEDHEIIVRPDDPETWENDPGFMVVGEGRTLVNHGIIMVEEKASLVNFGTVQSCDIFSLVEGKIEGNHCVTEHEFDEDGKCLYCDAAIVNVEIAIDEKPTKVYDGEDECPLEGLVFHIEGAQEDSTMIAEPVEAHFDAVEAGDHTLTITFQIADALDPLSAPATQQVVCEGAILPKTITVLPDEGQGKVFGEPEPEYGYTVDGLVGEDACSGTLSRVSGEDAGYYDFEIGELTAGDNYTIELLPALFEIVARPISSEDIHMALLDDQYYTGEPLEPEVWMLMGDSLLEQGVDFTVDYYDNVEVGIGSAVVNGIGNYFGTREAETFRILENPVNEQPAALDVSGSVEEGALGQGSLSLSDIPEEEEEVLLPGEYETFDVEAKDESPESPEDNPTKSADGKYEYVADTGANTIKITKYIGDETEITVPGEIDGKLVTTIGTGVFANMPEITSVTLPKSVTALEASVFFNSPLLSTVVVHDALKTIGDNQFGEQNAVVTRKLIVDAKDTQIIAADTYNHGAEASNVKFPLSFTDVEVSADAALALNTDFNIPVGHTFIVNEGGAANIATGKAFTNQGATEFAGTVQNNGTIYSCKAGSTVTVTGTLSGNTDIITTHEFDETTGKCRHCVAKKLFVNLKNPDAITKVYDGTVNASFSPDAYEIKNLEAGETVAIGSAIGVYDNPEVNTGHSVTVTLATDIVSEDYIIDQRTETGSITARSIAEATAQAIPDQKHTGKQVKPVVVLSYGDLLLVEGVDYVVDYSNNVDIGQATAIVTGTGNFTGKLSLPFNIIDTTKRTREIKARLIGNAPTKEYDGKLNVKGLSASDFEIIPDKVEAGDTVTITAVTASYTSIHAGRQKVVVRFSIEQQSASCFYVVEDLTIDGTITKKNLVITPTANQQKEYSDVYNVAYSYDGLLTSIDKLEGTLSVDNEKVGVRNITVGTLHAVNKATGKTSDDYNITVQPQTLTITAIPINSPKLKITPIGDQKYTSFEIKPSVTITNINNGYVLKEGTDFTLGNYKNNKEVGTATVTVTGKENCTGTIDLTFTIVKKPISDRDITCSEIATQTISGSNAKVEPTFTLTHKSSGGTKTLVKGTDYEATYSNNTKAGTGVITITAKSGSNYTGSRKETFKIKGSSSSSSSDTTNSIDYVYYRAVNGKQALIVEVDDKDAYYVYDLANRRFLIGDFTGTLKEGMEIHFSDISLVASVVPLTDKKTYPDEILLSVPGHRVRMRRVIKTADKTDLEYYTGAENGTEFDYDLFEAIMDALSDDSIGELWLDQENLGVVLYDENYQPLAFSQSEDALVPVVGGDEATAQKRLRIAPKPIKDANGQTVYADSSQSLAKYPTAHLRLTPEKINKLIKNGYTEIAYEVGGAEVRLPLALLAPEVTVAGNGATASVKESVDAYDICLESYDGHATEKETAALKGYSVVNPAARVAISAAIGKYPESVTAELAKPEGDAENGAASAALASAQGRAPDHPDVTFVAERLNYVTDIGAVAPVGVAAKRAQTVAEDTAGDEITFIEDEEAPAEAPEAEASAVEQPDGLTGQVYFLLKLLDTESVYKLPEEVIAEGTRNGGVIEIYENVKFADTRDKALSANDGTIFSESHRRFGSCVIRLSARLNATERQAVESSILTALSSETPMAVKSAFSQELPRFIPMLPAWNGSVRMLLNMNAETTPKNALALSAPIGGDASVADMAKVSEGGSNYVEFYPVNSGLYAVVEPPVQPTVQKPVPVVTPAEPEPTEVENVPEQVAEPEAAPETEPEPTAEPEPTEAPAATPEPVRDPEPLYAYTRRANGANMYWMVNTQNMTVEFYREDTQTYLSGSYTGSLVNGMNIQYSDGSEGNIRLKFQQTYKFASTTVDGEELLIEQGNAADVEEVLRKVRK